MWLAGWCGRYGPRHAVQAPQDFRLPAAISDITSCGIQTFRYKPGKKSKDPVAATKAMIGPVLTTNSRIGDFIGEFFFVPSDGADSGLMKGFEERVSAHRDQSGSVPGGDPPKFEQLGCEREAHGVLELLPRQARAVWQALRIFDKKSVHEVIIGETAGLARRNLGLGGSRWGGKNGEAEKRRS